MRSVSVTSNDPPLDELQEGLAHMNLPDAGPLPQGGSRRTVVVLQPYVPSYRVDLFEELHDELARRAVDLVVLSGTVSGAQAQRGDTAARRGWQREVPSRVVSFQGRSLTVRRIPRELLRRADVIVAEFALGSLDTWRLALDPRTARKLVLWGHIKAYVSRDPRFAATAKRILGRRAVGLLAYTASGAAFGEELGIDRAKFTVLNNSLRVASRGPRAEPEEGPATRAFLYLGGLDESKRLDVLLAVADRVAARRTDFELVIAGDGSQRQFLESQAATRPYVHVVGRVDGPQKTALAERCTAMIIAGRVGLVAVESFGLELPLIAPAWDYHAPEFDYLENGENALVVDDSVEALAAAVEELMDDGQLRQRLISGCRRAARKYTLDAMVGNFCAGLLRTGLLHVDPSAGTPARAQEAGDGGGGRG
jgi:glycosyltransferase involved in cell wall biosynthesis